MNKLILVFFCPIICFSQTETDTTLMLSELEEIIISATMSERDLDKLPIPTTIISEKEIMLSNASKLYDVINIQTGIISVPTKTGTEGLQMQGLDASYITILVDGFPIIGRSFGEGLCIGVLFFDSSRSRRLSKIYYSQLVIKKT